MTKTLSHLQMELDKLYKENCRLKESNYNYYEKNNLLSKKIKKLESNFDDKINTTIATLIKKTHEELLKENAMLKEKIIEIQKLLNITTSSNFPTSKTPISDKKIIPNSREKSEKKKGDQIGHKKNTLDKFLEEEITDTFKHEATRCTCGCTKLENLGIRVCKDNYDIDIRVMKIRNEFYSYKCTKCSKKIDVPIPNNLKENNQYGNNINSLALSLINEGYVSFNRTKKLISGFTSDQVNMSEGYLVKLQSKASKLLEHFMNDLKCKIISLPVLCWDDTVISINGSNSCLRFYGDDKIALYCSHLTKSKKGLDEDAILSNLDSKTVVVHDHNKVNYNKEYNFMNAECVQHLVRDLKKISESLDRKWSEDLIKLLIDTNNERKKNQEDNLYFENVFIESVISQYDKIVSDGVTINKKTFNQNENSEERTLLIRLKEYKENYLLWVTRFDVPFTNNTSERSLRSSKTKMKISGQFANLQNAEAFANIKSYIETCKRNNINPHTALRRLLDNQPYTVDEIFKINEV